MAASNEHHDRRNAFVLAAIEATTGATSDLDTILSGLGRATVPTMARGLIVELAGHPPWIFGSLIEHGAALVVPLAARGRRLGTMTLMLGSEGEYDHDDAQAAHAVGAHAGLAIDALHSQRSHRDAAAEREAMFATVIHDVKSPLGVVLVSADVMRRLDLDGSPDAAQLRKSVELIQRSASRIGRLVDELVDYSRLETGTFKIDAREASPQSIVQRSVEPSKPLAQVRQINLELRLDADLPKVWADQDRAAQVLAGFVTNGLRVTPPGGQLVVAAARSSRGVTFSVDDQGPGLDDRELAHFFTDQGRTSAGYAGAGLGLAVARGIVDAHGGAIWAERLPRAGMRFAFSLNAPR